MLSISTHPQHPRPFQLFLGILLKVSDERNADITSHFKQMVNEEVAQTAIFKRNARWLWNCRVGGM